MAGPRTYVEPRKRIPIESWQMAWVFRASEQSQVRLQVKIPRSGSETCSQKGPPWMVSGIELAKQITEWRNQNKFCSKRVFSFEGKILSEHLILSTAECQTDSKRCSLLNSYRSDDFFTSDGSLFHTDGSTRAWSDFHILVMTWGKGGKVLGLKEERAERSGWIVSNWGTKEGLGGLKCVGDK